MKKRLQDISSERVIAELAGTSFVTETGKVIEGNYQVGDIAPVVFDKASKRYLAAWKTRKDEPVKTRRIEDELPSAAVLAAPFVLAKFVLSEWKIFFTILGEDPLTSTKHRYIDLSTIRDTLTIGMFLNPYVLRLIEDRAYLGALILFDRDPSKTNMSEDITSGVVIKFKIGTKIAPAVSVTYAGYKYWEYEFDYRFITFGTIDEDLVDVIPDFDIQAGHPGALGQDYHDYFGDVAYGGWVCRASRNPWPGEPLMLTETSPHNWSGSASAGFDLSASGTPIGHADAQFIDNITVTQTSTKKGISKMIRPSFAGSLIYWNEYGREIVPIGAMVWCADENLDNLKWEIQFSARVEYDIDLTVQQTTGFIPHTLHAECGDIELPYNEFAPFKQKTFIIAIPFVLRRDQDKWTAEDHQDLVGKALCLETRGFYIDPFGFSRPRAVLFRLDSPGVIQEHITTQEFIHTLTERWFLPNHVPGRYRKSWGIPVGETRSKPKLLLDHTTVDYSLWSQDWQASGYTAIDQFIVNTFLSLDNQAFELLLAANNEDKWSYRVVQQMTVGFPFVYSCLDYHSLPPVKVEENNIYYVPITTYDPYWLNAKPQRTAYKHAGGGSAFGGGIEMCRICPVKSGPHDRSVYKIWSSVYDYNQNVPGIPQSKRASRQLLSWLGMSSQIPKVDSVIDLDGSAVVTLKHLTDPSKDLTASDSAFFTWGEVCDAGALIVTRS